MLINLIKQIYIDMSNADVFVLKNKEPIFVGNIKKAKSWKDLKSAKKETFTHVRERVGQDIMATLGYI